MKKNGFTLTELIAVIAIIGLLAVIAITAVAPIMNNSKNQTNEMIVSNLEDAAVTYAMEKVFIPNSCAITTILDEKNPTFTKPSGCTLNVSDLEVTVKALIDQGFFKDDAKTVNQNGKVVIYKYKTQKPKSVLDCYNGNTFIDKADCYNYDIKAYANKNLVNKN